MSKQLQELIDKKREVQELIDMAYNEGFKKRKEANEARANGDNETYSMLVNDVGNIFEKEFNLQKLMHEINDEIKIALPPVKEGELVDLRTNGSGSSFSIYLHGQPIEVGKIDYRAYHCDEYLGDIGYSIEREYRNHGYATEALSLLSEKLCEEGVPDFWISTYDDNIGSRRVAEKNGGNLIKCERGVVLYEVPTKVRNLENISDKITK